MYYLSGTGLFAGLVAALYMTRQIISPQEFAAAARLDEHLKFRKAELADQKQRLGKLKGRLKEMK